MINFIFRQICITQQFAFKNIYGEVGIVHYKIMNVQQLLNKKKYKNLFCSNRY